MSSPPAARSLGLLLTVPQASKLLGPSPKVIWKWIAAREIPSVRVGAKTYLSRTAVESWLQQLPSVSAGEAIRNLSQRAIAAGLRAEVIETIDTEEVK